MKEAAYKQLGNYFSKIKTQWGAGNKVAMSAKIRGKERVPEQSALVCGDCSPSLPQPWHWKPTMVQILRKWRPVP